MSCHKAIVVIIGRACCFHDNICYVCLVSVGFEHSVCRGSFMTTFFAFMVKYQSLILSNDIFLIISYISFCQKPFYNCAITKIVKTISTLNNSKTPKEQLKVE